MEREARSLPSGGKGGGANIGHQVVIPFDPSQVRSKFAAFDPFRKNEPDLLAGVLPLSLLGQQDLGVNYAPVNPQYQDPFGDTVR